MAFSDYRIFESINSYINKLTTLPIPQNPATSVCFLSCRVIAKYISMEMWGMFPEKVITLQLHKVHL